MVIGIIILLIMCCCLLMFFIKRPLETIFVIVFPLISVCVCFISLSLGFISFCFFFLGLMLIGYVKYKKAQKNNYDMGNSIYRKRIEYFELCRDNITGFYKVGYKNKNKNIKTREVYIKNNGTCNILYVDDYVRDNLNYVVEDNYFIIKFKDGGERKFLISYSNGQWNIMDKKCILKKISYNESNLLN